MHAAHWPALPITASFQVGPNLHHHCGGTAPRTVSRLHVLEHDVNASDEAIAQRRRAVFNAFVGEQVHLQMINDPLKGRVGLTDVDVRPLALVDTCSPRIPASNEILVES